MSRQFLYLDSVIRQRIQSSPRSGLAISAYIHPKLTFKMYTSPGRKETSEAWSYSLLSMDSLLSSLFFSMRLYLGEMETWFLRSRSRYFRLLSPWMHYSFAMFFLAYKNKKKKEEEKESVRRGVRVVSSWTENRWLQPRCALVVIGEQNFLLIIRLVPSLSFTTNLKRIFRALIAKRQHSSSSDDGPGDALLFTSLFVFYDPRCFFPHYFVTRSTL